jgi:hypothetical protein
VDPLSTPGTLDVSTPHVVAVVLAATVVVVLAVGVFKLLTTYGDELRTLWLEYGPLAITHLLERRRMPTTPWFCLRCNSHNARGHTRCYACGARRAEAEAPVPDADIPAGPGAGRTRRNRR